MLGCGYMKDLCPIDGRSLVRKVVSLASLFPSTGHSMLGKCMSDVGMYFFDSPEQVMRLGVKTTTTTKTISRRGLVSH